MIAIEYLVTQKDIEEGVEFDCFKCPHAIALYRRLKGLGLDVTRVSVTHLHTFVDIESECVRLEFNNSVVISEFLTNFDYDITKVKPGKFITHLQEPNTHFTFLGVTTSEDKVFTV